MADLAVRETVIPGFFEIDLKVIGDKRGWFKENYREDKLQALGLPKLNIVQNNFSSNEEVGVTRGLHAEPWDKYISMARGEAFGAWVDLRKGPSFGQTFTLTLSPEKAVYVPRGVANGYQSLTPGSVYSYLVNDYWSLDGTYTFVNLFDPEVGIKWPIPQDKAIVSEKDLGHPMLKDVTPMEL